QKADQEARQTGEAAAAKAKRIVEEGERRRAQIETLIGELEARRDDTLQELERLHAELASTIEKHKPGARSGRRNGGEDGDSARAAKAAETVAKP
ncbi:MAG: hypothetical protein ACRDSN_21245, partial [Pseudonocardiaceae bacterium]